MYAGSSDYDLIKEYTPSLCAKRLQEFGNDHNKILEHFVEVTTAETDRVRQQYRVRENVSYAAGQGEIAGDNQLLDIYYKDKENDTPIFVFIHGGYWQIMDKSSSGSFVAPLVERGYRVVAMDYNLCPKVTLAELMQQIWQFYKWLFEYAKETNATHISIAGHSAGAHLALVLLQHPEFVQLPLVKTMRSIFLISGVYDLRELWNLDCANPDNILGLDNAQAAKELSPYCWTLDNTILRFFHGQQETVKFHVLVGRHESNTFIGQSKELARKLNGIEIRAHFEIFEKYDHFDIIEDVPVDGSDINIYIMKNV